MANIVSRFSNLILAIGCCLYLGNCQSVGSTKAAEYEKAITELYVKSYNDEDRMPLEAMTTMRVRAEIAKSDTYEFFELYGGYKEQVGRRRAERWLGELVRKEGMTVMLTHPVSRFYIGDEFMRARASDVEKANLYFKYVYGDTVSLDHILRYRGRSDLVP